LKENHTIYKYNSIDTFGTLNAVHTQKFSLLTLNYWIEKEVKNSKKQNKEMQVILS